eukprot:3578097-Prymnesium_polylepis.1
MRLLAVHVTGETGHHEAAPRPSLASGPRSETAPRQVMRPGSLAKLARETRDVCSGGVRRARRAVRRREAARRGCERRHGRACTSRPARRWLPAAAAPRAHAQPVSADARPAEDARRGDCRGRPRRPGVAGGRRRLVHRLLRAQHGRRHQAAGHGRGAPSAAPRRRTPDGRQRAARRVQLGGGGAVAPRPAHLAEARRRGRLQRRICAAGDAPARQPLHGGAVEVLHAPADPQGQVPLLAAARPARLPDERAGHGPARRCVPRRRAARRGRPQAQRGERPAQPGAHGRGVRGGPGHAVRAQAGAAAAVDRAAVPARPVGGDPVLPDEHRDDRHRRAAARVPAAAHPVCHVPRRDALGQRHRHVRRPRRAMSRRAPPLAAHSRRMEEIQGVGAGRTMWSAGG